MRKIYATLNNQELLNSYLKKLHSHIRVIGVRFINNRNENTNLERCLKKRGKHKAFNNIEKNNTITAHVT